MRRKDNDGSGLSTSSRNFYAKINCQIEQPRYVEQFDKLEIYRTDTLLTVQFESLNIEVHFTVFAFALNLKTEAHWKVHWFNL